jgi:esterase/lipase
MKFKKVFFLVTSLIIILWLFGSLLLTAISSSIIFNNSVSWSPLPNYGYNQDFIKNSKNQNLSVWTFVNNNSDKYILYFHGNAGRIPYITTELAKQANVVSIAYPGYHESDGSPTVENVYESSELVYNWLVNEKGINEDKIIILGHSLGGSTATYLASKHNKAKMLILINTFSSIQNMCYRTYSIFCYFSGNIFNSIENAKNVQIPVRQFAYKNDTTIPFSEGDNLFKSFSTSIDKNFVELSGYSHSHPNFDEISIESIIN